MKEVQNALGLDTRQEMGSLSTTRWSIRYRNCECIIQNYSAIKEALSEEMQRGKDRGAVEACGILSNLTKPDFVVSLFVFRHILRTLHILGQYCQSKNATLWDAADLIEGSIKTIEQGRNNFSEI